MSFQRADIIIIHDAGLSPRAILCSQHRFVIVNDQNLKYNTDYTSLNDNQSI